MIDFVRSVHQAALHSPFDIEIHKQLFINYLEVCIHPDGTIAYAVPSHQEYLYMYLMSRLNKTRDEINAMVPKKYYFDMHTWLCKESGCIMVWNEFYHGTANTKQCNALRKLKMHGLYKGAIKNERFSET